MDVLFLIRVLRLLAVCSYISIDIGSGESQQTTTSNHNQSCTVPEVSIVVQAIYQYVDVVASVAAAVDDMNDLYHGRFRLNFVSFTNKSNFFCEQLDDEITNVAASYYYRSQRCAGVPVFLSPCKRQPDHNDENKNDNNINNSN